MGFNSINARESNEILCGLTDGAQSSSPSQSQLSLPTEATANLSANQANAALMSGVSNNKNRSHSTTSLYGHPNGKRLMRERKTVCSLHPLTAPNEAAQPLSDASGSNFSGHISDSDAMQAGGLGWRDLGDSENEAYASSVPGSALDSRRGSGLSTRCARYLRNKTSSLSSALDRIGIRLVAMRNHRGNLVFAETRPRLDSREIRP